jgi:hypothetical protein
LRTRRVISNHTSIFVPKSDTTIAITAKNFWSHLDFVLFFAIDVERSAIGHALTPSNIRTDSHRQTRGGRIAIGEGLIGRAGNAGMTTIGDRQEGGAFNLVYIHIGDLMQRIITAEHAEILPTLRDDAVNLSTADAHADFAGSNFIRKFVDGTI